MSLDLGKLFKNGTSSQLRRAELNTANTVIGVNLFPPVNPPLGALIGVPVTEGEVAKACGYRANVSLPWTTDATCKLIVVNASYSICKSKQFSFDDSCRQLLPLDRIHCIFSNAGRRELSTIIRNFYSFLSHPVRFQKQIRNFLLQ